MSIKRFIDGVHPMPSLIDCREEPSRAASEAREGAQRVAPELQQIFAERARRLAQPIQSTAQGANDQQVLVVAIGDEYFAFDSKCVMEVHPVGRITRMPGAAACWLGLVNLRGHLYAAMDFAQMLVQLHLHRSSDAPNRAGQLVLATAAGMTLALHVDAVLTVRQLTTGEILPPVADAQKGDKRPVLGITEDLVVLLDLDVIFNLCRQECNPA
jgi:chemotaxis signal transduction protein